MTATVLGLAAWGAPGEAMRIQLVHRAPKLVERLERRVVRRGHNIAHRSDEELHALRKALKKLRYSIEFLSSVCRDKQAKAYLHVIKKLLKHLGSLNDAVVVVAFAERLGGERQSELAPAVAALAAWATRRQDKARIQVEKYYRRFKSAAKAAWLTPEAAGKRPRHSEREASSALARAGLGVDAWRQLIPDDALIAEAESHLLNPRFDVGQASPEMIVGYISPVRVLRVDLTAVLSSKKTCLELLQASMKFPE